MSQYFLYKTTDTKCNIKIVVVLVRFFSRSSWKGKSSLWYIPDHQIGHVYLAMLKIYFSYS